MPKFGFLAPTEEPDISIGIFNLSYRGLLAASLATMVAPGSVKTLSPKVRWEVKDTLT